MPPIAIRFVYPPPHFGISAQSREPIIVRDRPLPIAPPSLKHNAVPFPLSTSNNTTSSASDGLLVTPTTEMSCLSSQSRKRKGGVIIPTHAEKKRCVTVRPLLRAMVRRCAAYDPTANTSVTLPVYTINSRSYVHPYSPASDWGNTRSSNPSPLEIIRANRMAQAKKMSEDEKREKKEKVVMTRELVKELRAASKGEVYVPKRVEEIILSVTQDTAPSRTASPVQSLAPAPHAPTIKRGPYKRKSPPARRSMANVPASPHQTRAQTQSPPSAQSSLPESEQTKGLPPVSAKSTRQRKSPLAGDAVVGMRERSKRGEAGVPARKTSL